MYAAMLTRVRVWELKVHNLRLPQMLSLLLLVMLSGQVLLSDGATVTWGHVNKYASLLHTDDVYLPPGTPGRDLIYGSQVRFISSTLPQIYMSENCLISLGISGRMPAITTGLRVYTSRI